MRLLTVTFIWIAVALVAPVAVAEAQPGADVHRVAPARLLFTFDHHESLSPGSKVIDSLGFADTGRVRTANGGNLSPAKHGNGRAVRFPAKCLDRTCPRAIISVNNRAALNAQRRPLTFGAQIRVNANRSPEATSTIIQKGQYNSSLGRWRLRLNGPTAKPYCLVKGSEGLLRMHSDEGLADGQWHTLLCTRVGESVRLLVDGRVVASKSGPLGNVSNKAPVRIGGYAVLPHSNQFFGWLDNVYLRVDHA